MEYPEKAIQFIAFISDTLPYLQEMKVWEYLDFFARAFKMNKDERENAITRVSALTNLENIKNKFLSELSKGMRQQVLLARVLLHNPEILLLDEPAAGLDPRARLELRETLRLLANEGKTIFISSHILSELEDIVNGAVIIEKGFIAGVGSIQDLAQASNESDTVKGIIHFSGNAGDSLEKIKALEFVENVELLTPRQLAVTISGGDDEYRKTITEI